jgi:hypothetical protein
MGMRERGDFQTLYLYQQFYSAERSKMLCKLGGEALQHFRALNPKF